MGLSIGINKNLCVVVDLDIFNEALSCIQYSEEFVHSRLQLYLEHGVPSKSTGNVARLARLLKERNFSNTAVKYVAGKQYVFSKGDIVGRFVAGHKPFTVISSK